MIKAKNFIMCSYLGRAIYGKVVFKTLKVLCDRSINTDSFLGLFCRKLKSSDELRAWQAGSTQ